MILQPLKKSIQALVFMTLLLLVLNIEHLHQTYSRNLLEDLWTKTKRLQVQLSTIMRRLISSIQLLNSHQLKLLPRMNFWGSILKPLLLDNMIPRTLWQSPGARFRRSPKKKGPISRSTGSLPALGFTIWEEKRRAPHGSTILSI